jgi:hypothetical protein
MKTPLKQSHCLPLSAFVKFFFAYKYLNLISDEAANGSRPPGGNDLGFVYRFPVKTNGQILLSAILCSSDERSPRAVCVTCILRASQADYDPIEQLFVSRIGSAIHQLRNSEVFGKQLTRREGRVVRTLESNVICAQ